MNSSDVFLAVDLGASSGRVLAGTFADDRCLLEEVHRFPNGPVAVGKRLHWDLLGLWQHIENALQIAANRYGDRIVSIGVDTWGVDYVLLDRNDDWVGPAFCYRDPRLAGILPKAFAKLSREQIFAESGLQFMEINTAYQLLSLKLENSPLLEIAERFLMIPDFFHWLLCGVACNEYTNASTTQLMRPIDQTWSTKILSAFDLPSKIFQPVVQPGTVLGPLRPELGKRLGLQQVKVVVPATHDTGSAVLAVPAQEFASAAPSWCYISSGTWSLMGAELSQPILSEACQRRNFTNEGGALGSVRLLKNISGLWPLQQCRTEWERMGDQRPWDEWIQAAERAAPLQTLLDPDDQRFASPASMLQAIESFLSETGQNMPTDRGSVCRMLLESLALRYSVCLAWLEEILGSRIDTIHIVGGGAKNRLLCQMTADACDRQVIAGPVEATAIGNVMMQAIGIGRLKSIAQARVMLSRSPELVTFQPIQPQAWRAAETRFRALVS